MRLPCPLERLTQDELSALRNYMVRYATAELRDADLAQDVVQQTLLTVLETQAGFEGRSTIRTWIIAILKHKMIDHWRREARNPIVDVAHRPEVEGDHHELLETLYAAGSGRSWGDPIKALENRRLWDALESGLRKLPTTGARAFCLSELQGVDTDGICHELGISAANCWVIVHRARLGLRMALGEGGFGGNV